VLRGFDGAGEGVRRFFARESVCGGDSVVVFNVFEQKPTAVVCTRVVARSYLFLTMDRHTINMPMALLDVMRLGGCFPQTPT
jgi:hypothetical protein